MGKSVAILHPDKDGKGTWGKDTKRRNRAYPPPLQESVTSALHKRGSPITITGNTRHSKGTIAPFLPHEAHNTPQKSPSSALPSKDFRSGKRSIPIELGWDKTSHIDNRSGMSKSSPSALTSGHLVSPFVKSPHRRARNRGVEDTGFNGSESESSPRTPASPMLSFSPKRVDSKLTSDTTDFNGLPSPPPSARGGFFARLRPRTKRSIPAIVTNQVPGLEDLAGLASDNGKRVIPSP